VPGGLNLGIEIDSSEILWSKGKLKFYIKGKVIWVVFFRILTNLFRWMARIFGKVDNSSLWNPLTWFWQFGQNLLFSFPQWFDFWFLVSVFLILNSVTTDSPCPIFPQQKICSNKIPSCFREQAETEPSNLNCCLCDPTSPYPNNPAIEGAAKNCLQTKKKKKCQKNAKKKKIGSIRNKMTNSNQALRALNGCC